MGKTILNMSNIEGSSRPIEGPDQYSSGGGSNNTGGAYNSREYLRDFSKIDMVLLEELWARELGFDRAHDKTEQFKNLFNKQLGLDKYPELLMELINYYMS